MASNAETAAPTQTGGPPKRRYRNYLLDARFQLKYTGYVIAVTLLVASVLGGVAYGASRAQTEMLTLDMAVRGETADFIESTARAYDRNLLLSIVGGVALLTISLGLTGILVTHRVVGPAYKLKRLFQDVRDGHLRVVGTLRKGDELQDVFDVYAAMIETLRERQREEIALLVKGIGRAREVGATDEALTELEELRVRMERALD